MSERERERESKRERERGNGKVVDINFFLLQDQDFRF